MKAFSIVTFVVASAASLVAAQNAVIGAPAPGTELSPGQNFVVQVNRPVRLALYYICHSN